MYLETIRIESGRVKNIKYHDERYRATVRAVYGTEPTKSLRAYIDIPEQRSTARVKCRISYTEQVQQVVYEPYAVRPCKSLTLVVADGIDYKHKAVDRQPLTDLYEQKGNYDDVLMVKNGLITDTYYGNVALLQNGRYYTPALPLLKGTMRAYLLQKGKIQPSTIRAADIREYEQLVLFNAMIPFGEVVVSVADIQLLST